MNLDNNNHSVFFLRYYLLLVVKKRRRVVDWRVSERLKAIFERIAPGYNISVVSWSYEPDYVSIEMKGHPNTELSKFINAYKSASSRLIKKEFPELRCQLFQEVFWSKSFCLVSSGEVDGDLFLNYIESQGEK